MSKESIDVATAHGRCSVVRVILPHPSHLHHNSTMFAGSWSRPRSTVAVVTERWTTLAALGVVVLMALTALAMTVAVLA